MIISSNSFNENNVGYIVTPCAFDPTTSKYQCNNSFEFYFVSREAVTFVSPPSYYSLNPSPVRPESPLCIPSILRIRSLQKAARKTASLDDLIDPLHITREKKTEHDIITYFEGVNNIIVKYEKECLQRNEKLNNFELVSRVKKFYDTFTHQSSDLSESI